jgi:hypothetical protein
MGLADSELGNGEENVRARAPLLDGFALDADFRHTTI